MHSSIFSGQVSHSRRSPLRHAFRYRVYMMYLDLDELDTVFERRWFWSTRRPAIARFRREDHFGNPDLPLDAAVRDLVLERTGRRPDGPIRLLTHLSWFGYCFNPISIYYCYNRAGTVVEAIVAEVSNTPWGERCCYVLDRRKNQGDDETQRYRTKKTMHVSPFMSMDLQYDWLLTMPGDELVVRIKTEKDGANHFGATLVLRRQEATGRNLAAVLIRYPLMTLKVTAGIYWQAFKLWLRGCPLHAHPRKSIEAGT